MKSSKKPPPPPQDFDEWLQKADKEAQVEDAAAARLISALRGQVHVEKRRAKLAERELEVAEKRMAHLVANIYQPNKRVSTFVPLAKARKHRNRGMPVATLSDFHIEECVDPATVGGLNEYDPVIAQRRLEYLFEGYAWHFEMWAKSWDVTDACLWVGGDIITGYIHEELMESNWLSPTEASLRAQQLITDGIEYLLRRCKFIERLYVPCSFGNHGRTTPKRRISTGAKNSFEWLMYHTLAMRFRNEPRVQFDIASGDLHYSELYGRTVRWHHGDDIGYQGGVGGLTIPLRKACDSWDTSRRADVTVIGHWHTYSDYGYCVGNGSVIGHNAYAIKAKCRFEPPRQAAFFICEQRGRLGATPVYCDPDKKSVK